MNCRAASGRATWLCGRGRCCSRSFWGATEQTIIRMPQAIQIEVEMPGDLARLKLPKGVEKRFQILLDKQDQGQALTVAEKREAEGLVDLAEVLSLLRLRAQRLSRRPA